MGDEDEDEVTEMAGEPIALTESEVRAFLRASAAGVPRSEAIVEIGVFQGGSLTALALGARDGRGAHVYGIDVWGIKGSQTMDRYGDQCLPVVLRSLAFEGLYDVSLIRDLSVKVAARWHGGPVGLLFIDGHHSEAACRADFESWRPHLAPGAMVVFDDYWVDRRYGVNTVVDDLFPGGVEHCGPRTVWARMP